MVNKIDTVPLPERPKVYDIPVKLLQQFQREPRIIIKHPWVVGIPVLQSYLRKFATDPKFYRDISRKFDIMLIPK